MRLTHITPTVNVPMILSSGLDPNASECERPEVWLCTPGRTRWAVRHVKERHGKRHLAVIEVNVPRSWLTRRRQRIFTCDRRIPVERIILWRLSQ